jgi:transposase-like protein
MAKSSAAIEEAQALLRGRLEEIEEERRRLERALGELGRKVKTRRPGRPRGRKAKAPQSSSAPKRRRKRRSGGRAEEAVAQIEKSPGSSAAEVAKRMKIQPNYLYRVLGELEKKGRVRKDARKYFPAS